ncbi:filamentous hemagglutinin family outer membrane protein [Calothrix sp. NIES-4071]|nr:filamentous hemagglutinin family outer membrane protein [Calothrix sp. NIES-4071]BAZ57141.1 filamentous hemagglutinin family outer membrane protein [Calothrix sp. NIES-4105]
MIRNILPTWLVCSLSLCLSIAVNPAVGQIVPDNTLPVNSKVTPQGNINFEINGGTVAGGNLFHSFQEFSVPTGGAAVFNNALEIQNILTRVTGGSVSNIDGLLQARGNANLFFLNPNGVVFGRNAALDIGGSFLTSTASSIIFADGSEFSAINPQRTSLLSVTVPLGLQFPEARANIINRSANLQVSPEKTIVLVGGDISLEGGQLTASQGRIEVGSVSNGLVSLNPVTNGWTLGYKNVNNFGNIQLLSGSRLSGNNSIQVQAKRVTLTDGSKIVAETSGNQNGGEIFVRAKDLTVTNGSEISARTLSGGNAGVINVQADNVEVSGASSSGEVFSTIAATSRGSGNSGSINITTNRLTASDGGDVSVTTFNSGKGGNLSVNASEFVQLIGARTSPSGQNFSRSGLFAATEGTGNGGDITINTPNLQVADGARVSISTRGRGEDNKPGGRGGNLFVNAGEIELSGASADGGFISGLFALSGEERPDTSIIPSLATGQGGDIKIETGKLTIRSGARVSAATEGVGQGGNITVLADTIDISGASNITKRFSTLAATSNGAGNSGNITINSRNLRVSDGADVSVTAFRTGRSGELNVRASESIELIGAGTIPNTGNFSRSGLFAATEGTQDGGLLTVETGRLLVQDGARISTSTRGRGENGIPGGRGGNLIINALDAIELSGVGQVQITLDNKIETLTFASGLFALSGEDRPNISASVATGQGGDIKIETGKLTISSGAQVSAATQGVGQGGNITVLADTIDISGASNITQQFSTLAATSRGAGNSGNITINSRNLKVSEGADVSVTAFGTGRSGELNVRASESIELIGAGAIPNTGNFSRSGLFAATEGTQDGGLLTVNTGRLLVKDGARISTSTRGRGENGIPGGRGGNLIINASDRVELSGVGQVQVTRDNQTETLTFASGLFALSGEDRPNISAREATGTGGNLEVTTGLLSILNGAELSVSASGSGPAGRLQVQAQSVKLKDGSIRGATVVGTGANTTLQIRDSLQLRGNSQISTVAGNNSNGGNITIQAGAIAILENSSIKADAGRQGGNVRITTQGLFAFPGAITSTSEQGTQFNGIIEINLPDVGSNQELIDVPTTFFSPENQVAQACTGEVGKNRNQFIITGRRGLPPSPTEPLSSDVRVSTLPLQNSANNQQVQHQSTLVKYPQPATGWGVNKFGEVILTANSGNKAYQTQLTTANCHAR